MNDSESNVDVSKVGNILLLSERINNNMGSISFAEKKERLRKSKLATVKRFLEHYESYDEWNERSIDKRTRAISRLAYDRVWKLS